VLAASTDPALTAQSWPDFHFDTAQRWHPALRQIWQPVVIQCGASTVSELGRFTYFA